MPSNTCASVKIRCFRMNKKLHFFPQKRMKSPFLLNMVACSPFARGTACQHKLLLKCRTYLRALSMAQLRTGLKSNCAELRGIHVLHLEISPLSPIQGADTGRWSLLRIFMRTHTFKTIHVFRRESFEQFSPIYSLLPMLLQLCTLIAKK